MSGTVTVGLDDSPESRAAAEWAVREALLRAPPSKIVHVQEPTPRYATRTPLLDLGRYQHRAEQLTHEAAEGIRLRHPGTEVITEQLTGTVADVLCEAAGYVGLLVPGSRALGGPRGFMVGSVGLGIVSLVAVGRRIRTGSLRCSHRPCHARGPAPHHRPRRGRRAQLSRRPEEENP
ncbi:universal stress protein [Streptomyces olivaceoviridis]